MRANACKLCPRQRTMEEVNQFTVLYDEEESNDMVDLILSCESDEDRAALEEGFLS